MTEQKSVSETAETTALLRAVACFEKDEIIRVQDNLARLFLSTEKQEKLDRESYRNGVKDVARNRGRVYEYVIARRAYFNALFSSALKDGIPHKFQVGYIISSVHLTISLLIQFRICRLHISWHFS